jgi:hypothetical protein
MKPATEFERAERAVKVRPPSSFEYEGGTPGFVKPLCFLENFVGNDLEFQSLILDRHTDDFAAVTGFPELLQYQRRKSHPREA